MQLTQAYHQPSTAKADDKGMHFSLSAELSRPPVSLHAMVRNSLAYAKLMLVLRQVVIGDWRPPQKDHTAYQEWVKTQYLKELSEEKQVVLEKQAKLTKEKQAWIDRKKELNAELAPLRKDFNKAKRAYRNWIWQTRDARRWLFDPVISVHPDSVIFEAFSLDESVYGRVSVPTENLDIFDDVKYGTTNIDFSAALADEIYRVRSYRPAWLKVAFEQVEVSTTAGSRVEKKIDLPDSWVNGFLQVQSAASMAGTLVTLSADTLAEVLGVLERQKERVSPRYLEFKLEKGKKPSITIAPWNIVVEENDYVYNGEKEGSIKIWGRRRLMVWREVLPYAQKVHIKLLGTGMPSYWSVSIDGHRFDLGLSGWTANDWAKKASFDLLGAIGKVDKATVKKVEQALIKKLTGKPADFAEWLDLEQKVATKALQELCKHGQAMFDPITGQYRWRKLLEQKIKIKSSESDERIKYATKLFKEGKVNLLGKEQDKELTKYTLSVTGKKVFKPVISLDADGKVIKAECTCGFFRSNKLRQGPCSHIVAGVLHIGS